MDRNLEEIHAEYPSNTGKEASNELSIKSSWEDVKQLLYEIWDGTDVTFNKGFFNDRKATSQRDRME